MGYGDGFKVEHPERTVWLGGLTENITHVDLLPLMRTVGDCKRVQVGRKGTGFAFFSAAKEAKDAIEQLNGSVVKGATIEVDTYTPKSSPPSRPMNHKGGGGGKGSALGVWKPQFQKPTGWITGGNWSPGWTKGGGCKGQHYNGGGGGSWKGNGRGGDRFEFKVQHPDRTVWIGNLAPGTTHSDLMPLFKSVGDCRRVQVLAKGTGFAFFAEESAAQNAIANLNGSVVNGQEIQVDVYTRKK